MQAGNLGTCAERQLGQGFRVNLSGFGFELGEQCVARQVSL